MVTRYFRQVDWPVYVSLGFVLAVGLLSYNNRFSDFIPNLPLLVLIYWTIYRPDVIGLGRAWMIGLIQDFLTASLFGQHALIYVLVVFFIKSDMARVSKDSFFEFVPWLVAFVGFDILISGMINWVYHQTIPGWTMLYPVIGCILIWPWLYLVLNVFETTVAEWRK